MIKINLLKPERKEVSAVETVTFTEASAGEKSVSISALVVALGVSIGVIVLLYFLQNAKMEREQRLLEERQQTKKSLEYVFKELEESERLKNELNAKLEIMRKLKARQKDAVLMMDKLSSSLPDWVWLTNLSYTGSSMSISGKALSNNLIADFINNLFNSNYFKNVKLISSKTVKEGGTDIYEFSLTCEFIKPEKAV